MPSAKRGRYKLLILLIRQTVSPSVAGPEKNLMAFFNRPRSLLVLRNYTADQS